MTDSLNRVRVPAHLVNEVCYCTNRSGFHSGEAAGFDPRFFVCADCDKPPILIALKMIQECDNCEEDYIPRSHNDRMYLCRGCE